MTYHVARTLGRKSFREAKSFWFRWNGVIHLGNSVQRELNMNDETIYEYE